MQVSYTLYDAAQTWERFKVVIPEDSVTLYQEDAVGDAGSLSTCLCTRPPHHACACLNAVSEWSTNTNK
jgi:hypothetical protein